MYIVHRVDILKISARNGVAGLVISGQALCLVAHLAAALFRSHLDLEDSLLAVLHGDEAVLAADSQQSRLVHEVFKIGAREAGSALCDAVEVDILGQHLASCMYLEYRLTTLDIGQAHIDLTVEAAGTKQRVIKDIGTVRCRHDDNALVIAEAVHLDKQLVERLLTLVMTAAEAGASLTADSVDLIDEDDRRSDLLCLIEQVTHTACADTDIQLNEV